MSLALVADLPIRTLDHPSPYDDDPEMATYARRIVVQCSYTRFNWLRTELATWYGVSPYSLPATPRDQLPRGGAEFWLHSDCDGSWSPWECKRIYDLLIPFATVETDHPLASLAETIATGCLMAWDRGSYVEFS